MVDVHYVNGGAPSIIEGYYIEDGDLSLEEQLQYQVRFC